MHYSRVSTFMIDCLAEDFDAALDFWCNALGLRPARSPTGNQRYVTLGRIEGPLNIRLQKVEQDPGYHLDIETDAMRPEVARLEAAGGTRKYYIQRWWVMEDPAGNAFCIVRPESKDFPRHARQWDDEMEARPSRAES